LDADSDVKLVGLPGSSLMDVLRPKASSQPAAASLPDAFGALVGRSAAALITQAERQLTGVNALWLGGHQF
jgi:protease-4